MEFAGDGDGLELGNWIAGCGDGIWWWCRDVWVLIWVL
jgi:hypothetical protein